MKKLFLIIFLFVSISVHATTYYVSTSGNDSNSGLTSALAWKTCNMVSWGHTFVAGDNILFKCGDTWKENLYFPHGGSAGNNIVINSYGTGNKPVITAEDDIPNWSVAGNWSNVGNTWSITLSPAPSQIKRLWINGVEVKKCLTTTVSSTEKFYYNTGTSVLYIYSTSNPALVFTSLTTGAIRQEALFLYNSYVKIQNMDFRGGSSTSVRWTNGGYITFDNCNIGWHSDRCGIDVNSTIAGQTVNNCEIKNCTFDTGAPVTFLYDYEDQSTLDGILLQDGCDTWSIHDNTFKDWAHSAFSIVEITAGYSVSNINFYNNYMTAPNIYYGRGIGVIINSGLGSGINIYKNYIYNCPTSNQLSGGQIQFYYNIIDNNNRSAELAAKPWQTCTGLELSNNYSTNPSGTNIWNNTIMNTHDAGIVISPYGAGTYNVSGLDISNNIIFNCGQSSRSGGYSLYEYDQQLGANTFRNNLIYKSGTANVIYYGHDALNNYPNTVTQFNSKNGNGGDVISGNFGIDPLLISIESDISLEYNATSTAKTISLSYPMIDVKGTKYATSVTLQPFTSIVLLKDNDPDDPEVSRTYTNKSASYHKKVIVFHKKVLRY